MPTKRLNEQIKRNAERFPEDFMFQLSAGEKAQVVANCDNLANLKFAKSLPFAFTEHGAIMAANVLSSKRAVEMCVCVVRAFVRLRELVADNKELVAALVDIAMFTRLRKLDEEFDRMRTELAQAFTGIAEKAVEALVDEAVRDVRARRGKK